MTALLLLAFGVLILVVGTIYVVVVRPRINQWGASDQGHLSAWLGDEFVAEPSFVWTNAITIVVIAGWGSPLAHRGPPRFPNSVTSS